VPAPPSAHVAPVPAVAARGSLGHAGGIHLAGHPVLVAHANALAENPPRLGTC
jgi:hypothetical protein